MLEEPLRHNRIREALDRIYDQHPPQVREYLRRYQEDPKSRVFAPLAEAYRRLGRVDEAMSLCLEGIGHHPDFHGGRVALAKCYIDKQHFDKAKDELERVVQRVPENLLAQKLLGDVFLGLGQYHQALHCLKMAVMLAPHDVQLEERVRQLERSVADVNKNFESETATVALSKPSMVTPLPAVVSEEVVPLWAMETDSTVKEPPSCSEVVQTINWVEGSDAKDETPDSPSIENLLQYEDIEESFQVGNVADLFKKATATEITTTTLGDLYFSQGLFEKSLRIYERLVTSDPENSELLAKIQNCRQKMGVLRSPLSDRRIRILQEMLERVKSHMSTSG